MSTQTIGFIGLGRLGVPLAGNLVDAGHTVVGCQRGRSDDFVARGGTIAGDGSARAVAEAADIVFTCLPGAAQIDETVSGPDGLLAADGPAPIVVELSTAPPADKARVREQLVAAGGELLDCPVSGTPEMAAVKKAVVYASGDEAAFERVGGLITAMLPASVYVGKLGDGTRFKHVANLLAFVHVTVAAEAMAFAGASGLDLQRVAEVVSASPGATSGQFSIRAPMMAAGQFEPAMVTVDMMRHVLDQIEAAAADVGAQTPVLSVVKELYERLAAEGEGQSDPAKLSVLLQGDRASA